MDFIYRCIMKALQPLKVLRNRWFGLFAIKTKPSNGPAILPETRPLTTSSGSWCKVCYNLNEAIATEHGEPTDWWHRNPGGAAYLHGGGVFIYPDIEVLRKSVAAGCGICKFLEETYAALKPATPYGDWLRIELRKSGIRYVLFRSRYEEHCVDVYRPADSTSGQLGTAYDHIPVRPHIDPPNSESSKNYLRSCFKTCTETHDLCRQDPLAPRPKRLLDLGSVEDGVVRLHETSRDFREPYVALSYCWGKAEFLKARRENVQTLKQGFSLTELPESIRDAIRISRELGLRYLWVDSLCIIQPDGTSEGMVDWLDQSAKMCSIYQQAYLTIAASSVSSAYESFLQHSSRPRYFQSDIAGIPGLTLAARVQCQSGHHYRQWMKVPTPVDPIDWRGWVLQESLLSNRMISFSTDELQWRCRTTTACQCQEFYNFREPAVITPEQSESEIVERWDEIVKMYTKRRLTNQNDKFPALSGICQLVERKTGWQYVAGMWKNHLFRHLLWHAEEGMSMQLPSVLAAPSFTWASLNCPVIPFEPMRDYIYRDLVELVDLTVLPADDNPFGQIMPGSSLTLRGKLIRNVLADDILIKDPPRYTLRYDFGKKETGALIVEDVELESFDFVDSNGIQQRSLKRSSTHTDKPTEKIKVGTTVSLLPILSEREPPSGREWRSMKFHVLVLGVSPSNHDAFERLGVSSFEGFELLGSSLFDDSEGEEIVIY